MKKQLYAIGKRDWLVTIKQKKDPYSIKTGFCLSKKEAILVGNKNSKCGDQVQIFKVSYEFRDAYVVADPRAVKAKMKSKASKK